ncbi:MAG: hypothetical protein QOD65_2019, partial [Gaiellales bacterium]|nr:hypothetical protein [Gaiellales bacterium]
MLPAADIGVAVRPPLVTVRSAVVGELDAVRAVVTRVSPRTDYIVRFHVRAVGGSGCVAS